MNGPPIPNSSLVPLSQASASQLAQAVAVTAATLAPYYPALTWDQCQQALCALKLPLRVTGQQTVVTALGLSSLIHYLENRTILPAQSAPLLPVDDPLPSTLSTSPEPHRRSKNTYNLRPDVLEALKRVSYWRREGKSALVNQALILLLTQYPESHRPVPPEDYSFLQF